MERTFNIVNNGVSFLSNDMEVFNVTEKDLELMIRNKELIMYKG